MSLFNNQPPVGSRCHLTHGNIHPPGSRKMLFPSVNL
jgi:hypothetical protein